ncbi:hypothetical protein [Caenimonas aquaedulcis]|uniref:Uncharacterized protein n=1 Tax=Caenimonas aquaedulcis TaxID=2793270 RepID=A0A931MID5_9BURK|nr:hypothetical protein [Caenimonas aquaedulcis]MBG9389688.1 hypothetical protein [Caenimonas aquaedulcis]
MLKFLKRLAGIEDPKPEVPRRKRRKSSPSSRFDSAPGDLPAVTEGSNDSDWALWKDSVAAVDSQMSSLMPRDSSYHSHFVDTQPTDLADLDPFEKVGKNRDH